MIARNNDMQLKTRLVSAAAAAFITVMLQVFIGLLFSAPASAQTVQRAQPAARQASPAGAVSIERGRYLISISGCNDCHTNGYAETGGRTPEGDWLTGVPMGFRGPWGTSYPANLRLTVQSLTESQWLSFARVERLPPMPWFALRDMSDDDLRSLYRYIRALGPKGSRSPAAVAPGGNVTTPFILFVPQNLPAQSVTQVRPATRDGRG